MLKNLFVILLRVIVFIVLIFLVQSSSGVSITVLGKLKKKYDEIEKDEHLSLAH